MESDKKAQQKERAALPHRESNTAVVRMVELPTDRRALFLALDTEMLHDDETVELAFRALPPCERSLVQLLLYLTYCCKGQVLQLTLEDPDFSSMSAPVREDFAHGRLFCFVLDMNGGDSPGISSFVAAGRESGKRRGREDGDPAECVYGGGLLRFVEADASVFRSPGASGDEHSDTSVDSEPDEGDDGDEEPHDWTAIDYELGEEAYNAFMRLQLVRQKAVSLNNAMIVMRDPKGELNPAFEWLDIRSDTLNPDKIDRKKVKELQGSMYVPACQGGKQTTALPEAITGLTLKSLAEAIGRITDTESRDQGKELFERLVSRLAEDNWRRHKVVQRYSSSIPNDARFLEEVRAFTRALAGGTAPQVCVGRLLVFRYSIERLIDRDKPDAFLNSMLHRHMPVTKPRISRALREIRANRRTRHLARLLTGGRCHCPCPRPGPAVDQDRRGRRCREDCQTAYACFYNVCEQHPFSVSRCDYNHYFAHLYPHLGKLERLSKDMKTKYGGHRHFESIANMVFDILAKRRSSHADALYAGLRDLMGEGMLNSRLSLGRALPDIHEELCLEFPAEDYYDDYAEDPRSLNPVKVYDHALVRYMFSDSLQVGRLFQASTTFNYVVTNTAPRYTIERIMLFNVTGPGEGKSYANNVLNCQFRQVKGCIETLTSFTPQAFKYKQQRKACVVMIDDAHITHEKNLKALDKESSVIPNTFKNLLDTSVLESDVVGKDACSGKVDTVRYHAVHNCGFVWNTNTLGFVSDAWADRCVIMESEFSAHVTRTRSSKQLQDTVEKRSMDKVAAVCLYRQNLVQSATMIAESEIMQFDRRFDAARDACVEAMYASHVVCAGALSRRVSFCINQLVFAEAMKLACHFVFDVWVPPWTEVPDEGSFPDLRGFWTQLNRNRLRALDRLSFGQICLETNAAFKLCAAACLPDICPRVLDAQGRFACKALGRLLCQVREKGLKTAVKDGQMCISGVDSLSFSGPEFRGGNDAAHEMLQLCSNCTFPERGGTGPRSRRLCSYKCAPSQNTQQGRRGHARPKKVSSVTLSLEAVYDMLALYAPEAHRGFWDQLGEAMMDAYDNETVEKTNAFGTAQADGDEEMDRSARLVFSLDFGDDPVRSLILEATAGVDPLNELSFNKCAIGGQLFRCTAPLYYGGLVARAFRLRGDDPPRGSLDPLHERESERGPADTFHGPRLSVYSPEYSGLPVKNLSSFCATRTVYHQERILLREEDGTRRPVVELEPDWEWLEACEVFNRLHGHDAFTVESLKRDYAVAMTVVKGEDASRAPMRSRRLARAVSVLRKADGRAALEMRTWPSTQSRAGETRHEVRTSGLRGMGRSRKRLTSRSVCSESLDKRRRR
uniref:Uncharacterized protein n=1 Tax=Oryzias latipes TaxID=8090 RepID=A0A286P9Q9_ORYLA|nr:hypothetical protein ORF56-like [Oryzias latipes]